MSLVNLSLAFEQMRKERDDWRKQYLTALPCQCIWTGVFGTGGFNSTLTHQCYRCAMLRALPSPTGEKHGG